MKRYIKIWKILIYISAQIALTSRFGAAIFILAKLIRFLFFFLLLLVLGSKTSTIAGFTLWQMVFFYVTFNLVDALAQFFLREVYRFRYYVVSGDFDYILTKPMSPLFRSLLGGSDILDIPMLILSLLFLIIAALHIGPITSLGVFMYLLLIGNAFLIAFSFHIFVLVIGILTTEVDNVLFLYRDLTQMGRVPVDIYQEPLRGFITFIIPVGIMMTFPAKALMGLISPSTFIISFLIGGVFFLVSLSLWRFSLRHYSSASS